MLPIEVHAKPENGVSTDHYERARCGGASIVLRPHHYTPRIVILTCRRQTTIGSGIMLLLLYRAGKCKKRQALFDLPLNKSRTTTTSSVLCNSGTSTTVVVHRTQEEYT